MKLDGIDLNQINFIDKKLKVLNQIIKSRFLNQIMFILWVIDMQNDFLPLPFEGKSSGSFAVRIRNLVAHVSTKTIATTKHVWYLKMN